MPLIQMQGRLMCTQDNYTADIVETVVFQVMGRPLSICVRNTAWSIQQVDAEGLKLNRTILRYQYFFSS